MCQHPPQIARLNSRTANTCSIALQGFAGELDVDRELERMEGGGRAGGGRGGGRGGQQKGRLGERFAPGKFGEQSKKRVQRDSKYGATFFFSSALSVQGRHATQRGGGASTSPSLPQDAQQDRASICCQYLPSPCRHSSPRSHVPAPPLPVGFGGPKRLSKQNDASSAADVDSYKPSRFDDGVAKKFGGEWAFCCCLLLLFWVGQQLMWTATSPLTFDAGGCKDVSM